MKPGMIRPSMKSTRRIGRRQLVRPVASDRAITVGNIRPPAATKIPSEKMIAPTRVTVSLDLDQALRMPKSTVA